MFQGNIQSINAAALSPEASGFIKLQEAIYSLCKEIEEDERLKSQIQAANTPQDFLKIATEKGYEFSFSDLEDVIHLVRETSELDSDEYDNYELSEEDLEMVAGGTARVRAASKNSYWHTTGVMIEDQCFYSNIQSLAKREVIVQALKYMEKWEWLGNGDIRVTDTDGKNDGRTSYTLSGFINDGSLSGKNIDISDPLKWQTSFDD